MVFNGGISLKRLEKIVSLKMKILLAVAFAAAVFVCGGCKKAGEDEIFLETVAESCDGTDPHKQQVDQGPDISETEKEEPVYVHVCGQVKQPGVYSPDEEQARQWMETGKISGGIPETPEKGGKVDLNRASVEELMTLSGIGQSRAEAIVRYREEIGDFQAIEDVMKVSGIKENAFNKIKDNITV